MAISLDSPNALNVSDCVHFPGVDWDQRGRKKGVYKIVERGHNGWSPNVDDELGNFDYLLGADVGSFIMTTTTHS